MLTDKSFTDASEEALKKREDFAVSLRKGKKQRILAQKRKKLMMKHFGEEIASQYEQVFSYQTLTKSLHKLDQLLRAPLAVYNFGESASQMIERRHQDIFTCLSEISKGLEQSVSRKDLGDKISVTLLTNTKQFMKREGALLNLAQIFNGVLRRVHR